MRNSNSRRAVTALALALMLVFSAGFALAAAPTVDTEASDTATQTELQDGDTIAYAGNSASTTLQFSADSNQTEVEIRQNDTLLSTHTANTSSTMEFVGTGTNLFYWNLTLDDDESGYPGIEAGPGETVELEYRIINNTDASVDPDTTNVTVNWANHENRTFANYESDDVEVAEPSLIGSLSTNVPILGADNVTDPAKADRSVDVNGDDQETITVHVSNGSQQDALEATQDSFTSAGVSFQGLTMVDGDFVPIIESSSSAPDWVDTDEDAYVTIADDGGEVVAHNAGAALGDDTEEADLTVVGAEQMNFGQITSMMSSYDAGWGAYWTAATNGELVTFGEQFDL